MSKIEMLHSVIGSLWEEEVADTLISRNQEFDTTDLLTDPLKTRSDKIHFLALRFSRFKAVGTREKYRVLHTASIPRVKTLRTCE